jgi:hypothetical protein
VCGVPCSDVVTFYKTVDQIHLTVGGCYVPMGPMEH